MDIDRTIRWRALEAPGLEHCHIMASPRDIRIRGIIIGPDFGLAYRLKLDEAGFLRTAKLERTDGRTLELFADGAGNWTDDRADPLPALRGCIDIDVSATPLTNALPIWRNQWTDGTPQRFAMAWVDVASMTVQRDEQLYTRLDPTHFRYQAADASFERLIEVDADGLVVNYPGLFERAD